MRRYEDSPSQRPSVRRCANAAANLPRRKAASGARLSSPCDQTRTSSFSGSATPVARVSPRASRRRTGRPGSRSRDETSESASWGGRAERCSSPLSVRLMPRSGIRSTSSLGSADDELLELAARVQVAHDVGAADELPVDVELRAGRPARVFLQPLAQLLVGEDVERLERGTDLLEHAD